MNKTEYRGLKGAAISMLWIMEKLDRPFRKSDFYTHFSDKTVAGAFELLEDCGIITPFEDAFKISPEYMGEVGIITTPTTTRYIDNIITIKNINTSSSRSEFFRQESHDLLVMVGEPKRTKLASLPHATPEYVSSKISEWQRRRQDDRRIRVGLLVKMIESNDPAQSSDDYDPDRYTRSEFAEFINS